MQALNDAYVGGSIRELADYWGSELRWVRKRPEEILSVNKAELKGRELALFFQVPGGHVSAVLLEQPAFRAAISDSLDRL